MIKWLLDKRRRLLEHIEEKNPACAPTDDWWIICAAVCPVLCSISTTVVILQGKDIILSQQKVEIERLIVNLSSTLMIIAVADFNGLNDADLYTHKNMCVLLTDIEAHVKDQGSWARDLLAAFSVESKKNLLSTISKASIDLIYYLTAIRAERDANNNAREYVSPAIMPLPLAMMRTSVFIDVILDRYRPRLIQSWNSDEIENIEKDHQELVNSYRTEPGFKERVEKHDHSTLFNVGWDEFKGRFQYLRQFCAGIGCVFANTTTVESDFSVLKWEMDDFRSSMTNLTLEGVFQTKQRDLLAKLVP
jgi:hypothetical protein